MVACLMRRVVLFFLLTLAPFAAQGEIYNCDITRNGTGDWMPTRLLMDHKPGDQTAEVWDPFIKYFVGKPLQAKVTADNEKRVTVVWRITRLTNTEGVVRQYTPRLEYRATLLKPSLKLVIKAFPIRYSNSYRAEGRCRVHKK